MNILKNVILFLCSLIVALGIAEYAARKIDIEFLSGRVMFMGIYDSKVSLAPVSTVNEGGKINKFDMGNCYSSNPSGRFPLKIKNPADGKEWHCVVYNKKLRRQGFNPERTKKVVLIGDSFTFGIGLKEDETLGYLLNKRYPQINFLNMGVSGIEIDEIVKICSEIEKSNTDLQEVIYFYNLNDVLLSETVKSRRKYLKIALERLREDEEPSNPVVKKLSQSALFKSIWKIWQLHRIIFRFLQNYDDMYLSEDNRREFLYTMDQFKFMKEMLARRGIPFRVIIYPELNKDILGRYPFENIHSAIIKACNERGVDCLDGYEPFKSYYFMKKFKVHPVDYHPNGLANIKMVDYIKSRNIIKE